MNFKLDVDKLHFKLNNIKKAPNKTGRFLVIHESTWLLSVIDEFLANIEDENSKPNTRWSITERELIKLKTNACKLSKNIEDITPIINQLFLDAVACNNDIVSIRNMPSEFKYEEELSWFISNIVNDYLPVDRPKIKHFNVVETEISCEPDDLPNLTHNKTTDSPNDHTKPSMLINDMKSKLASDLYIFSRMCGYLIESAKFRKGRGSEKVKNDKNHLTWLIQSVVEKLSSIRDQPKPIPLAHAIPVAEAIWNSLVEPTKEINIEGDQGKRALKDWKALHKKTQSNKLFDD